MGTRCKEVEMAVLNASKRLVLVLNKADLVNSIFHSLIFVTNIFSGNGRKIY
jgi:ribosome biogenesis GTPase A